MSNKSILVTGAGGSIGKEITRQVSHDQDVGSIVISDISEPALFEVLCSLQNSDAVMKRSVNVVPILGDISSASASTEIDTVCPKIDIIYHAAAYKHVNLSMKTPSIYYLNNISATRSIINIAKKHSAALVHISTDKAVWPTNHMGYSKRICEFLYFDEKNRDVDYKIVRFGNVLNSTGSVIPIFQKQIADGGPVTVTDVAATRYFMSISEAVELVLSCHKTSKDYKINILDMGSPQLIDRLARNLIEQSGQSVATNHDDSSGVKIKYIGLRAGEKLHEELSYVDIKPTGIRRINYANEITAIENEFLQCLISYVKTSDFGIFASINWSNCELVK